MKKIKLNAQNISADNLGNLYVISENKLFKYNSFGELKATFFADDGAIITHIETKNPFKTYLYFGFEGKINILDKELSIIGKDLFLSEIGISGESLFTISDQGGFWIWDLDNSRLVKLNSSFTVEYEKFIGLDEVPDQIKDNKNFVFFKINNEKIRLLNVLNFDLSEQTDTDNILFPEISSNIIFFNSDDSSFMVFDNESGKFKKLNIYFPDQIKPLDAVISERFVFCRDEVFVYFFKTKDN